MVLRVYGGGVASTHLPPGSMVCPRTTQAMQITSPTTLCGPSGSQVHPRGQRKQKLCAYPYQPACTAALSKGPVRSSFKLTLLPSVIDVSRDASGGDSRGVTKANLTENEKPCHPTSHAHLFSCAGRHGHLAYYLATSNCQDGTASTCFA